MDDERLKLRLDDILSAIEPLEILCSGQTAESLSSDWVRARALERGLEIISEASRHVPIELKATAPHIPWRQVADIGNILRHAYERVDMALLLAVVTRDLPPLRQAIASMIQNLVRTDEHR
jgi:uncharacterized protein with HEPN domain